MRWYPIKSVLFLSDITPFPKNEVRNFEFSNFSVKKIVVNSLMTGQQLAPQ